MKASRQLDILLIEDNPADVYIVKEMLRSSSLNIGKLVTLERINEATDFLQKQEVHLALLDLSLPDSFGLESYFGLRQVNKKLPVIILTGNNDAETALNALKEGAQDYLVKGEFNENLLSRSIQYSVERKEIGNELLESNERFNIVARVTNDIIWDRNLASNEVFFVGENFPRLFDYDSESKTISNLRWLDLIHPEDRSRVQQSFNKACKSRIKIFWEAEYRMRKKDNTYLFINDRGYIIRDGDRAVRMIGAMKNVTDVKLYERRITSAVIRAQETERKYIGEELHDNINQILSSVKLYLDLAITDEEKREELVVKSFENVSRAIEEIRKISRKFIAPGEKIINLYEMINNLVNDIEIGSDIHFNIEVEDFSKYSINHEQRIVVFRIIQEQLNNIIKHSQAKNVSINVFAKNDSLIVIDIQDDGIGFDTFSIRRGVGLTNITSRAEIFNGKVQLESAPGKGFRLIVTMDITS